MKNTFGTKIYLITLLAIAAVNPAWSFLPDLGHLVRHQPGILRGNPLPFTVDGVFEIDGERAPFQVTWAGVKSGYTVEFKKLPASWTAASISELTLFRDGNGCMLSINRAPYPCSVLRFWGDFEFNASNDRVVRTVSAVGLAPSSDQVMKSVNSKDVAEGKYKTKIKPVVKTIQGTPMSVLEYANSTGSFIDFDSINWAPVAARFPVDGMVWDFTADPDFYLEKSENKNNLIVSRRIEVKEGEKMLAVIRRDPLKRVNKATLPTLPSARGSASEVPFERFSEKGRNFLKVLFLTH